MHLIGKKHLKAMARYRMENKMDKNTILRSLPDTGFASFSRAMTHPINLSPSLLPPNTMREGARDGGLGVTSDEGPSNSFSDISICDSEGSMPTETYTPVGNNAGELVEVMNVEKERQCRGFWPPLLPPPPPRRISPGLGLPPPPPLMPNVQSCPARSFLPRQGLSPPPSTLGVQCPPSPPPLLLPSPLPAATSSESRLPRRCPSPTLVMLSSSDEEVEDEGEKSEEALSKDEQARSKSNEGERIKEAPSKEEGANSNLEIPSELTGGALSSLWNSKVTNSLT